MPLIARAQYSIDWFAIDSSVGTSTSAVYTVSTTIGQLDVSRMAAGNYTLDSGFWSLIAAVESAGMPWLSVAHSPTNTVVLYWPVGGRSCVLQESSTLATNTWSTVTNTPVQVGANMQVNVPRFRERSFIA